ncbi:MFS general substrate transporter [Cucurbitaria berberidis CBS 394.84]|uniref:MFS general substrate transporter n=1 Tax=Cucurbitaria berberidis CBS 394.84 TaxID=1168544 RepID=A0A9P4LAL8_9PLEO|nr:MFS general substrate transporter [Cucurbitaria berberidis CBS 394.84]KAF1847658.1 MFS general substrate transporter [Cucurbitaria berberidis CBS 394.84]
MTEVDVLDLRRVRDSVPWRLWAVAVIGFWERAAFWGLTAPWQNYMEHPPHSDRNHTPGALGLGQVKATQIYCAFYIFYYVTPSFVAPLADSRLGQYPTLVASVMLYCAGCTVLTISSLPTSLTKDWGLPGLILAMFLIGLGGGGFKAITAPFIADQYTETKPRLKRLKSGELVVTDHQLTLQYIYNLYFWVGNVGSLSWFATVYIEKRYGFAGAYGLTLGFMAIAMFMLVFGKRWFVRVPHKDNVLPQATRIITCAIRNGFRMKHADPEYQLEHRRKTVAWSSTLVDELTRGLRACRVLLAFVMFYICFDQMQNNLISQAGQMKTGSTPNDLLPAMNQVGCIVLGPLIQEGLYPFLHKRRIYMKPITRITIGFVFIALAMLYATFVQYAIYASPPCYDHPEQCGNGQRTSMWVLKDSRPNVWIQAPLYFLIAIGEIFAYVTGLEYAYDNSPKDMKVLVQAISLLLGGVGSACAMALAQVAHDPNLIWLYASLTGGMAATALIFWLVFRKYDTPLSVDNVEDSPKEISFDLEKGSNQDQDREESSLQSRISKVDVDATEVSMCPEAGDISIMELSDLQMGSETTLCLRNSDVDGEGTISDGSHLHELPAEVSVTSDNWFEHNASRGAR